MKQRGSSIFPWSPSLPEGPGGEAIREGRLALVLMAGGIGSRLGFEAPKGCFPVTPARRRSLFELFRDKVEAASKLYGRRLEVALLTSKKNHDATRTALQGSSFSLCEQEELPYLDERGEPLEERGPDGNGALFKVLRDQGLLERWKRAGVTHLTTLLIDNPLADPVDARWLSFHLEGGYDVSLKAIMRDRPGEKLGLLIEEEGTLRIVEYSEIREGIDSPYGNTSLALLTLDFAIDAADWTDELPYHLQWKRIEGGRFGWKRERFLFDHFTRAKRMGALIYPRELTFAPLKEGSDLPALQKALAKRERSILRSLTGSEPPPLVVEIDPDFYYPEEELKRTWRGRQIPDTPYISRGEK